jgi:CubicO group peptidase (beta-lactamase class C family)
VFRLGASQLGPGPGEWLVEDPRVHGLSSAKLASAAERHARELDQRDCLLVVKDGVIVHETYREGGDADTLHYLDGVGRAAAALLIGAAEHQGVLDLDTPLSEYGIAAPPVREYGTHGSEAPAASGVDAEALAAHPELRWGDEWSRVTARHVLGQATGLGEARAGETFDARVTDEILDVLSQVLRATTGMKPAEWAKEHFTGPLGVPDFFARDVGADGVADGGVRVAGGQMATCRDAARFGQLLINRGEWLGEDGTSTRLVRADFVRRVVNPVFPARRGATRVPDVDAPRQDGVGRAARDAVLRGGAVGSGSGSRRDRDERDVFPRQRFALRFGRITRRAALRPPAARAPPPTRPSAARFWGRRVLRSPWRSPSAGSASSW